MPEELKYYQDIAKEDIANDSERDEMFDGIDDMWENDWELPANLKKQEWMREFISTAPHDAMLAATRTFANNLPSIQVQPLSPESVAREDCETIEALLDWHLFRTLRRGVDSPLWNMMLCAVKYSTIAFQTEFLPYKLKGQSGKRIDALKRFGDFAFVIHNPHNVHARYNPYTLESVTLAYLTDALDVYRQFGKDNPGVKEMVGKLESGSEAVMSTLAKTKCTLYDFMDYDDRVRWVSLQETFDDTGGGSNAIEIERTEHDLPFITWVYRKDDHPLLKPVYDADLWKNSNVLESLRYYLVVSTVAQARTWSRTPSGEGVELDHSEPGSQARMRTGEEFGILPPSQLDPNVNMLVEAVRGDIRQTTVAQALTTLENLPGGTPFSTINAILQAAISTLAPIKNLGERALEDALYLMLKWAKHAELPLMGYRRRTSSNSGESFERGADVHLMPDEYEPDNMYIDVTLNAETPTDKQARLNMAILASERLPISPQKAMEDSGIEYSNADLEDFMEWSFLQAKREAEVKKIIGAADIELQTAMTEMQQQTQPNPQQQAQEMTTQNAGGGFDTRQGAPSPIESNPNMRREAATGESVAGEEIA